MSTPTVDVKLHYGSSSGGEGEATIGGQRRGLKLLKSHLKTAQSRMNTHVRKGDGSDIQYA